MPGRLIVISNRVPLDGPGSGGLVVALHESLQAAGGVWIGSRNIESDTPDESFAEHETGAYQKLTFDLTPQDQDEFYIGFANSVLWPLCHRRRDLIAFETHYAEGYTRVNERLAKMLTAILKPDDRVWVHDYHFFPLATYLRAQGARNPVGMFLHIPFPTVSDLPALPDYEGFAGWISAYDLVGLQTQRDVASCLEMFRETPDSEFMLDGSVKHDGKRVHIRSFPIGIDADVIRKAAADPTATAKLKLDPDEKLLIGVDRLDYSKGLPNRFKAMHAYLERRAPTDPKTSLVQIAPPTRELVLAYREIRDELERMTGAINGEYSELDWIPIRYIHRHVPREWLASLFRRADAALVTPLADGMNLVAKEYVAAQDPDDPGVLILSHFAGAAEVLDAALEINPYDTDEMADAIAEALRMPLEERKDRHRRMLADVTEHDVAWWSAAFLGTLAKLRPDPHELDPNRDVPLDDGRPAPSGPA